MANQGNFFAILDGDEDDNIEKLISRVKTEKSQAVAEQPPAVLEKKTNDNTKPLVSYRNTSDHGGQRRITNPGHGSGMPNKNGNNGHDNGYRHNNGLDNGYRQNNGHDNGYKQNNGLDNGYRQNNGHVNGYRQNNGHDNGYRQNGRGGSFRKNYNGLTDGLRRANGYYNEKETYVNDRPNDRSNGQKNYNRRVDSAVVNEATLDDTKALTRGNGFQRGRSNYGRRVIKGNHPNGSEVMDGVKNKHVESQGEDGWQYVGRRRSKSCGYRHENPVEEKEISETKEQNEGKGVEREVVGATEGDVVVTVMESEAKNKESEKVVISKEEAERLAKEEAERAKKEAERLAKKEALAKREAERLTEAKRMTLKEYEKKLGDERKKKLEEKMKALGSLTIEEQRKVTTDDKDFKSMQIVGKKNYQQSIPPEKLNSAGVKLKKGAIVKDDKNALKVQSIVVYFKTAGSNFRRREGNRDGNNSARGDQGNINNDDDSITSLKKKADGPPPPSVEDSTHFPALGCALAIRT